ncbi:protein mono-ADP-ribosyltransferase TIPARP-like isoform X2 [Lethenteron reissneri]|uniref:protein mono-ADP-ribosyltransferase TIPARP-like isoform X2 n=1 Tax=Lethenteron reissneri TaxID=7753 RepID=UPI002AB6920F|nr:protein mono-ADP-ribosyltransferase TIPARP-like isoform X2 [Lethenteron reissneri]
MQPMALCARKPRPAHQPTPPPPRRLSHATSFASPRPRDEVHLPLLMMMMMMRLSLWQQSSPPPAPVDFKMRQAPPRHATEQPERDSAPTSRVLRGASPFAGANGGGDDDEGGSADAGRAGSGAVEDLWSGLAEIGALPYHWQMRRPGAAWESIPARAQELLERVFCNPENDSAQLRTENGILPLDFATMEARNPSGDKLLARRLESSRFRPYPCRFYRRDQNRWLRLDETSTSIVTSSVAAGIFNLGQWPLMRMRPEFVSSLAVTQHCDAPSAGAAPPYPGWPDAAGCSQPSTWVPMDPGADFVRVTLEPAERAYRAAYRLFHQTVSETKALVLSIERVQNPFLWEKYCRKKAFMLRKLPQMPERELELNLFHGTTADTVPAICKHNFDPRLSGKNAAVYGNGSYFATAASFSHGYAGRAGHAGDRYVFIAKALVGRHAVGQPGLRRPPALCPDDLASDLYDSCVDNAGKPSIFAIFDSDQCYPYFLIRYRVIGNEVRL